MITEKCCSNDDPVYGTKLVNMIEKITQTKY